MHLGWVVQGTEAYLQNASLSKPLDLGAEGTPPHHKQAGWGNPEHPVFYKVPLFAPLQKAVLQKADSPDSPVVKHKKNFAAGAAPVLSGKRRF